MPTRVFSVKGAASDTAGELLLLSSTLSASNYDSCFNNNAVYQVPAGKTAYLIKALVRSVTSAGAVLETGFSTASASNQVGAPAGWVAHTNSCDVLRVTTADTPTEFDLGMTSVAQNNFITMRERGGAAALRVLLYVLVI